MLGEIRIISLRGAKKDHLARCGEFGELRNKTLCKLTYDPMARTGSRPVGARSGKECRACLKAFDILTFRLRTPKSNPHDLKMHLLRGHRPACGQDCPGDCTSAIERVTCEKCLAIADSKYPLPRIAIS